MVLPPPTLSDRGSLFHDPLCSTPPSCFYLHCDHVSSTASPFLSPMPSFSKKKKLFYSYRGPVFYSFTPFFTTATLFYIHQIPWNYEYYNVLLKLVYQDFLYSVLKSHILQWSRNNSLVLWGGCRINNLISRHNTLHKTHSLFMHKSITKKSKIIHITRPRGFSCDCMIENIDDFYVRVIDKKDMYLCQHRGCSYRVHWLKIV